MAYSKFTLKRVVDELEVRIEPDADLFLNLPQIPPSDRLTGLLFGKTAFSKLTEMARREMFIAPILNEVFSQNDAFTIFSGENFEADKKRSLTGMVDYLICIEPSKLLIQAPVMAVGESKRNIPEDGMAQCIAELYASHLFNSNKKLHFERLFGVMTNGEFWLFGRYLPATNTFNWQPHLFSLDRLNDILGILTYFREEALNMYARAQMK